MMVCLLTEATMWHSIVWTVNLPQIKSI